MEAGDHDRLTLVTGPAVESALRPTRGRPLLVHLWASWCRPCVGEWPALAEWLRHAPLRGVEVVSLSVDEPESLPAARHVLASLGRLPGRTLAASLDDAFPAIRALDTEWDGSLPSTILVDGRGRLALSQHGLTRFDAIEAALRGLGSDAPPSPGADPAAARAGDAELQTTLATIAADARGRVGAAAMVAETRRRIAFHGDERFPMQSVYKVPIAMAVLRGVDEGRLSLAQRVRVGKDDLLPREAHSPIRDENPEGVEVSLAELLRYAVSESDGTASDVLLRLAGGASKVQAHLAGLGLAGMVVANTEKEIVGAHDVQYRNWATPVGAVDLLDAVRQGAGLSAASRSLLLELMTETTTGPRRLRGLLPAGAIVAHKTGTSGTSGGVTAATNDIGLVTLPDGRHLALAVFVSDSTADLEARESVIARIAQAAWDWSRSDAAQDSSR